MPADQPKSWEQYFEQLSSALDRVEVAVNGALVQPNEGSMGDNFELSQDLEWLLSDDSLGIGSSAHLGELSSQEAPVARALFVRQAALIEKVRGVQGEIRSHMNVAQASVSRVPETSVYLDTSG